MTSHSRFLLVLGTAVGVAVTALAAQNPPAPQAPQQPSALGQIAIPQPCTPDQIMAAQAAATTPAQAAGRGGRGGRGGAPCHMPDPREGLKAGLYDAGQAAQNLKLVTTLHQPDGMFDPNPS